MLRAGNTGDSEVVSTNRLTAPIELPTKCADSTPSGLAEPRDVADPHTAAVIEVDDLRGLAEAQHVRSEHAVAVGERRDVVLPAIPR